MPNNVTRPLGSEPVQLVQIILQYPTVIRRLVAILIGKIRFSSKRNMYYFVTRNTPMSNSVNAHYYSHDISLGVGIHSVVFPDTEVTPEMWTEIAKFGYYEELEILNGAVSQSIMNIKSEHTPTTGAEEVPYQRMRPELEIKPLKNKVAAVKTPPVGIEDDEVEIDDKELDNMLKKFNQRATQALASAGTSTGANMSTGFKVSIIANAPGAQSDDAGIGVVPQLEGEMDSIHRQAGD